MKRYRNLIVILLDIVILTFTDWAALAIRFESVFPGIPTRYLDIWRGYLPYQILITLGLFLLLRMYSFIWHSITARDVARMVLASVVAFAVNAAVQRLLFPRRLPYSVYIIMLVLQMALFPAMRSIFRFTELLPWNKKSRGTPERVMIIGAGSAGRVLGMEFLSEKSSGGRAVCFIDDNRNKVGKFLNGVPIVGGREKIEEAAKEYRVTEIVFAIPSADLESRRDILTRCARTGCKVLTMPRLEELLDPEHRQKKLQQLRIEDLLGRDPIRLDKAVVNDFIRDRVVLVTGGGGSIGSELCRQVAANNPKKLIILDIYENNAYEIQQELRRVWKDDLDQSVEIASVRDKEKMYRIFDKYRPDIVFHAAAHKHVPLMEGNPEEAVKNNIFGTYHVVRAAEKYGVKKFVMISTDKAVNPTNVMGASKRFCEMILQSRRDHSQTEFCSVRFGNVLGSNGSVVPLFEKQIADGGPVTITDKRITRFFMTIPEAVQLVMEAGAIASQNQIFVLDMGKPVTILSLAENMIRLHGLEPYKDIDIVEIGLRPGEKLYEELLMESQRLTKMGNSKIFVEEQEDISPEEIQSALEQFDTAVTEQWKEERVKELMHRLIPTYHTPEEVNSRVAENIRQSEEVKKELAGTAV